MARFSPRTFWITRMYRQGVNYPFLSQIRHNKCIVKSETKTENCILVGGMSRHLILLVWQINKAQFLWIYLDYSHLILVFIFWDVTLKHFAPAFLWEPSFIAFVYCSQNLLWSVLEMPKWRKTLTWKWFRCWSAKACSLFTPGKPRYLLRLSEEQGIIRMNRLVQLECEIHDIQIS